MIGDIYSKLIKVKKLADLTKFFNEHGDGLYSLFSKISESDVSGIVIDYISGETQLCKMIDFEKNEMQKAVSLISLINRYVCRLVGNKSECYTVFDGKTEMNIPESDIYYAYITIEPDEVNIFYSVFLSYALESLFSDRFYCGIDFEYINGKYIKLYQISFEHNVSNTKFIFMLNPADMSETIMKQFIDVIMCNNRIKKIFHGSDALDLPYVFNDMFKNDTEKIIVFIKSWIDTRYACEYFKLNRGAEGEDSRCKIYDDDKTKSGVFTLGLITEEKQKYLTELLYSLPPERQWNLRTMNKTEKLYSFYDALFLKYFYFKIISNAISDEKTPEGEKLTMDLYKKILYEFPQFATLETKKITDILQICKKEVDPINIFMVRTKKGTMKLIDVFQEVVQGISLSNPKISIDSLIKVTYFKNPVMIILKKITYSILSTEFKIYQNKLSTFNAKLSNAPIYEYFNKYGFNELEDMFRKIEKIIKSKIIEKYK